MKSESGERTYGQYCPIAAGLDVIGDRWVLLICRELGIGPQRFTDLRAALPGIAPNLLTERLRSLQAAGLVEIAELPPPAARSVYQLTAQGRGVVPILRAVARFGVHQLDPDAGDRFSAARAAYSLMAPWWRAGNTDEDVVVRLDLVDDAADLISRGRELQVLAADDERRPDVTIRTDVAALVHARQTGERLVAHISGSAAKRKAALSAFALSSN